MDKRLKTYFLDKRMIKKRDSEYCLFCFLLRNSEIVKGSFPIKLTVVIMNRDSLKEGTVCI